MGGMPIGGYIIPIGGPWGGIPIGGLSSIYEGTGGTVPNLVIGWAYPGPVALVSIFLAY